MIKIITVSMAFTAAMTMTSCGGDNKTTEMAKEMNAAMTDSVNHTHEHHHGDSIHTHSHAHDGDTLMHAH